MKTLEEEARELEMDKQLAELGYTDVMLEKLNTKEDVRHKNNNKKR